MPGCHGKKSGIHLSVKHKLIVKKYLKYIDFNKKMTLNEKETVFPLLEFHPCILLRIESVF